MNVAIDPTLADICPKCKKPTMFKWKDTFHIITGRGKATARMCQNRNCNFVEERKKDQ